eukprot:comp10740_c0_seq1/m.5388 comp10740_c0_seq1/g.5388  ORF comp10740_c0_seq1/g.5388 comp10740_c0_seq1/m.5388 type:complete len:183 (-) comp10740_c0_seq1:21-569(-)
MFKKFSKEESVSGITQTKSSVQRGIRQKILEQYPNLEDVIEEILPKKSPLFIVKCHDRIQMLLINNEITFFNSHDGPWAPTLRLLHKYPSMMIKQQVDKGAIKFVLSGANIMCPGLTSPGAKLVDAPAGSMVAIFAEGKEHPLAIGHMNLSSEEIARVNKGPGVDNVHYLNDGLWNAKITHT